MNRSILIVICDFLLVSLLAFSSVDINKVTDQKTPKSLTMEMSTNQVDAGKDLTAVMRQALDEERKNRDRLIGELSRLRDTSGHQQNLLAEREKALTEREKQIDSFQQDLRSREQYTLQLQQEQTNLATQLAGAQASIQGLHTQLENTATSASVSQGRLQELEAERRRQEERSAALQAQLTNLQRSNEVVKAEQQRLASQLQVAEVEKRSASEQVSRLNEEVKVQREEKAKLTEGVKALASRSGELAKEIRDNRALAPNTIFNDFLSNRVQAAFTAVRPGLFGEGEKRADTVTVLISDGTNNFALCHVQETPFTFSTSRQDFDAIRGQLRHGAAQIPVRSISFCWPDPRAVLVPVADAEAKQLGAKVYKVSQAPFNFQDAVLVGAKEGYYGECRFQIDQATPGYLKLDNSFIRGIFGKFNPSRGDLVFSRTGEILGMMANNTYCMMIRNFDATATFHLAKDIRTQHTGETLARLSGFIQGLPTKLQ